MPWNNYYYSVFTGFLQSSVQGINHQTTLGGGVARYFKNTNRVRFSMLGGLAWQSATYNASVVPVSRQQIYAGAVITDLNVFLFKKTNLKATALFAPAFSDLGRAHVQTDVSYYLKLVGNLDLNVHSTAIGTLSRQRSSPERISATAPRTQMDVWL